MADLAYPDGGLQVGIVSAGVFDAQLFIGHDRQVSGANERIAGISMMPSEASGDYVTLRVDGIFPVKAGSNASSVNLTPGTPVKTDSAGKAIAATADTDIIVGVVWCDSPTADAADELVLVHITPTGRVASS
jgi:hypothetical protein